MSQMTIVGRASGAAAETARRTRVSNLIKKEVRRTGLKGRFARRPSAILSFSGRKQCHFRSPTGSCPHLRDCDHRGWRVLHRSVDRPAKGDALNIIPKDPAGNGFTTAALLLGTGSVAFGLSIFVAWIPGYLIALPCAILAVIFGTVGRRRSSPTGDSNRSVATAGIILGVVSIALTIAAFVFLIQVLSEEATASAGITRFVINSKYGRRFSL